MQAHTEKNTRLGVLALPGICLGRVAFLVLSYQQLQGFGCRQLAFTVQAAGRIRCGGRRNFDLSPPQCV